MTDTDTHIPGCPIRDYHDADEDCKYPSLCNKPLSGPADIETLLAILRELDKSEEMHELEDVIHARALEWFRDHSTAEHRAMAELALSTRELQFSRWYS